MSFKIFRHREMHDAINKEVLIIFLQLAMFHVTFALLIKAQLVMPPLHAGLVSAELSVPRLPSFIFGCECCGKSASSSHGIHPTGTSSLAKRGVLPG